MLYVHHILDTYCVYVGGFSFLSYVLLFLFLLFFQLLLWFSILSWDFQNVNCPKMLWRNIESKKHISNLSGKLNEMWLNLVLDCYEVWVMNQSIVSDINSFIGMFWTAWLPPHFRHFPSWAQLLHNTKVTVLELELYKWSRLKRFLSHIVLSTNGIQTGGLGFFRVSLSTIHPFHFWGSSRSPNHRAPNQKWPLFVDSIMFYPNMM